MRLALLLCLVAAPAFAIEPAEVPPPPPLELSAPAEKDPARDRTIHECIDENGAREYTDEPCRSQEAMRAERKRDGIESLDAKDDWICGAANAAGFAPLDAKHIAELPLPQREALGGALFESLREGGTVQLGPLGSAHVCTRGREVKVDPIGRVLVKRGELVKYMNDPATPAALEARCTTLFERCGGLDPGTTLRNCIDETPTCSADPPWNQADACCPKECIAAFRNATRGATPVADAIKVVFGPKGCM